MHPFDGDVSALLADVADAVVMPRYRNLLAHEVSEKSRGEVVTVADHEAEIALRDALLLIDPSARVVGEEACNDDPSLLDTLCTGRVWVVDPIDGTANFAAGLEPFGLMVALLEDGVTRAGWLYDPVCRRICHAVAGGGAFVNGERLRVPDMNRERPIAALATQFMSDGAGNNVRADAANAFDLVPIPRCAAEHYPRLALGVNDIALFQRTLPWDHLAGALFLEEAGGKVTRWDGSPYRAGDPGRGIVAATTPRLWERAVQVLRTSEPDFPRG